MEAIHRFIKHQNERLDVEPVEVRIPGLHPALTGYRACLVADLHFRGVTAYHGEILQAVRGAKPDVILLAGDTMDEQTGGIDLLADFFQALSSFAPVVAVLGNNDCQKGRIDTLRDMYARSGVTLLENESRLLNANGCPLRITGLTDPRAVRIGIHRERPMDNPEHMAVADALAPSRESVRAPSQGPSAAPYPEADQPETAFIPSILLMHQPQLAEKFAQMHPSLIVAGHAHGGQFRLPGIGGLYAPNQGVFPRWTSGLYRMGDSQMLVSRGLGNHGFPLRLNNRPHIPVAVFLPA